MRKSFVVTCACAAGLAFCSLANAQNEGRPGWPAGPSKQAANQNDGRPGWKSDSSSFIDKLYATTDVGLNWMPNFKYENISIGAGGVVASGVGLDLSTNLGIRWDFGIGLQLNDNFKFQLESGYINNEIDTLSGTMNIPAAGVSGTGSARDLGLAESGSIKQIPVIAALIYEFNVGDGDRMDKSATASWRFRPYVGGGLGAVYIDSSQKLTDTGFELNLGGSDWVLAYQAMVGLEYEFDDNWFLSIGYRFLGLDGADFGAPKINGVSTAPMSSNVQTEHTYNHSLQFGLRVDF